MVNAYPPVAQGLYDPANEHDACGVGFVANIKGRKSHAIVEQGLTILKNLTHRGAVGADPLTGDGAGILVQIPDQFFREELAKQDLALPPVGEYGVGMVFLPQEPASRFACEYEIERAIKDEGQVLLGWRDVPVDNSDLAEPAKKLEPVIRQVFVGRGAGVTVTDALERKLYIIRKSSGHAIQALRLEHGKGFYVPSMSARLICYKGMLLANQVGEYYLDLKDPRVESALALVHQRFSTNTFPSWDLAHPFRMICHNGEINTVRGNVNWIRARQGAISSPVLGDDLEKIWPLIYPGQSDSASFDNALELLVPRHTARRRPRPGTSRWPRSAPRWRGKLARQRRSRRPDIQWQSQQWGGRAGAAARTCGAGRRRRRSWGWRWAASWPPSSPPRRPGSRAARRRARGWQRLVRAWAWRPYPRQAPAPA